MTVANITPTVTYLGDGTTVDFVVPYRFIDGTNLHVTLIDGSGVESVQTYGLAYSVSGGGTDSGGAVSMIVPPAIGEKLRINRVTPRTQTTDYQTNDSFPAETHELALDKEMMILQEIDGDLGDLELRALRVPAGETIPPLQPAAERIGYAGWVASELKSVALPSTLSMVQTVSVPDRAAMAALPAPEADTVVYMAEDGREGMFAVKAGAAPTDTRQGIYVASLTPGFYFERLWDGVHGRPEWFHDDTSDWLGALEACLALCPVTVLGNREYEISDTWVIQQENRAVIGVSRFNWTPGQGSQIVLSASAPDVTTANIIEVGYDAQPAGSPEQTAEGDGFLKNVDLRAFTIRRGAAANPPADPNNRVADAPIGLKTKYLLKCHFEDLLIIDSPINVYCGGVIYSKFRNVEARMDGNTTAGNQNNCTGWWLDGTIAFGYAGGNASLYLFDCVGVAGRRTGGTESNACIGLVAKGAYVDSFLYDFEVAGTDKGMVLDSQAPYNVPYNTVDLHVFHPIIDQVGSYGIEIISPGVAAGIEITNPYITSSAGQYGINMSAGAGVTITGGQIIGPWSTGAGLLMGTMANVSVKGLKIIQSAAPVIVDTCESVDLEVQIINFSQAVTLAVQVLESSRCRIAPHITGVAGLILRGIDIDDLSDNCVLDATKIGDTYTADRIVRDSAAVTVQGKLFTHWIINPGVDPIAFRAQDNSGQATSGTTAKTLTWASELFDYGGHFDNTTGIFTAPVAGLYQFEYEIMHTNGVTLNDRFDVTLEHSVAAIASTYKVAAADYNSVRGSALCHMDVGDTMRLNVQRVSGTGVFTLYSTSTYNNFSGRLIN